MPDYRILEDGKRSRSNRLQTPKPLQSFGRRTFAIQHAPGHSTGHERHLVPPNRDFNVRSYDVADVDMIFPWLDSRTLNPLEAQACATAFRSRCLFV